MVVDEEPEDSEASADDLDKAEARLSQQRKATKEEKRQCVTYARSPPRTAAVATNLS